MELNKMINRCTEYGRIDPRAIAVDEANNERVDYGDIDLLVEFIRENGVESLDPINVKKLDEESFQLVHGYRRMRAVNQLIAEGVEIARVRAIVVAKTYSFIDEVLDHLSKNSGKSLTATEESGIYAKLISNGWTVPEISKRTGKPIWRITDYVKLKDLPPVTKSMLADGIISVTHALSLLAEHGSVDIETVVELAGVKAEELGETKITPAVVAAVKKDLPELAVKVTRSKYLKVLEKILVIAEAKCNPVEKANLKRVVQIVEVLENCGPDDDLMSLLLSLFAAKKSIVKKDEALDD